MREAQPAGSWRSLLGMGQIMWSAGVRSRVPLFMDTRSLPIRIALLGGIGIPLWSILCSAFRLAFSTGMFGRRQHMLCAFWQHGRSFFSRLRLILFSLGSRILIGGFLSVGPMMSIKGRTLYSLSESCRPASFTCESGKVWFIIREFAYPRIRDSLVGGVDFCLWQYLCLTRIVFIFLTSLPLCGVARAGMHIMRSIAAIVSILLQAQHYSIPHCCI
ncbi:hypothetical protein BJ170DRAFT_448944 [Xylariales sp. AK1849]|nr:hypothetical protein BJ170DRAFT_448944 [Xylariales sp. AK1849]